MELKNNPVEIIRDGSVFISLAIGDGSTGKFTLGKEDYVTLNFSLAEPVYFKLGDYADLTDVLDESLGGKFSKIYEVVDIQTPTYNTSTGGYDYELRLDAYYMKWKNKIFKYTPEAAGQEASWNLTAGLDVHLEVFAANLKALGYTFSGSEFTYYIDSTVEDAAKLVSYDNTNLIDALTMMAETWECDWWVTENIIRFGRCETGDAVSIEIGRQAADMSRSESKGTFATRLYAFGSTRNITTNYRPVEETVVVNGIVQKRLMLPTGTPYIDAYRYGEDGTRIDIGEEGYEEGREMPTEEAVEGVIVNDSIYPRTTCEVGEVGSYTSTTTDEETGEKVTQTFYYVTDTSSLVFDEDYILEGYELRMIFQSGSLNGMDFAVTFRKAGTYIGDTLLKDDVYEIVANEDYGRSLPDDTLKPAVGDTFVLYNWDSTRIEDLGLVAAAENELLDYAEDYIKKTMVDDGTYNTTLRSDWVYADPINRTYDIGQRVELINKSFFESGRLSRVIGFELKLDIPYDAPVYTIGESTTYSRLGALEDSVDSLTYKGQNYTGGGGGSSIYVIRTNDSTAASNTNVYSALRTLAMFLRKDMADETPYLLTSQTGFQVGEFVTGTTGAIVFKDSETGQTTAEVDRLYVRLKAYFDTLEIVNVNSVGGRQVITPAGSIRVTSVEETDTYYRCFFLAEQEGEKIENRFVVGDQAFSQNFNAREGVENNISNHYYWRLVEGVGENYIDLSKTDFDTDSDAPEAGDVICQLGSREDTDRQNALIFSSVDSFSPSITLYEGIDSYSFTGKDVISYGVDKTSGKAFFNVYGEMYVGDREGTTYVKYTQDGGVKISGQLEVGTKIGDGTTIEEALRQATENAVNASNEEIEGYVAAIEKSLENLQDEIDGAIETWFYDGVPTLANEPAVNWTTDELKNQHLGDLYYDGETGKAYRFQMDGDAYVWTLIEDTDIATALAAAKEAQDTADSKRRVFITQPTASDEYDTGDLWVNATYGELYSNDILRATVAKSVGEAFSIDHWTLASKYTDDTLAEEIEANMRTLSTTVNNLSGTVSDMRDLTDEAFKDGIVTISEASAIEDYLNIIETTRGEVESAYNEVYGNELLDGVAKTNLEAAYSTFTIATTELVEYIEEVISSETATTIDRAVLNNLYDNFNTKYADFISSLNAANNYVQDKINSRVDAAFEEIDKYAYLKAALNEHTTIEGGLILTSLIALGYTENEAYHVMSGTNGEYDAAQPGGGIASWWGGAMIDKMYNPEAENAATGLVRMDGTGYFANGALWWESDGTIHADPQSFIINENQLGDYVALFQIIYNDKAIDYVIPQYPFDHLDIADYLLIGGQTGVSEDKGVKISKINDGVLYIDGDLVVKGYITMYADDGSTYTASTLLDLLPIDPNTLSKEGGVLSVIGGGGGSGLDGIIVNGGTYTPVSGYITLPDYVTPDDLTSRLNDFVTFDDLTAELGDYVTTSSLSTTLSNYVTSSDLTTKLGDYVTNTSLSSTLASYVTTSSLNTTLGSYVTSSALNTTLADYVTTSSLNSTLSNYVTSDELVWGNISDKPSWMSSTVGSTTQPVYINAGTPTVCSSTVGGTAQPIYLNAGTATACSSTVGSATLPVYMSSGTITQCTASSLFSALSSSGSTNLSATIAGQTRTISNMYARYLHTYGAERQTDANIESGNGSLVYMLSTSTMTSHAPSATGFILHFNWDNNSTATGGQLFVSTAASSRVQVRHLSSSTWTDWRNVVTCENTTIGSSTQPVYINSSGYATACSSTVGSSTLPVYMSSGTITACGTSLAVDITGNAASASQVYSSTSSSTLYLLGVTSADAGNYQPNKNSSVYMNSGTLYATNLITTGYITCGSSLSVSSTSTLTGAVTCGSSLTTAGYITMYYTSDRRQKANIREVTHAGKRLLNLGKVYDFDYKEEAGEKVPYLNNHTGFMYQDVIKSELAPIAKEGSDGYGSINYIDPTLISLVCAVGQEHETRIEKLEKENKQLKRRIKELERRTA